MHSRALLLTVAALLLAGVAFAADSPYRGSGVIMSIAGPDTESYVVQRYDKLTQTQYGPAEDEVVCGKTYRKGQKYPMLMVTSQKAPTSQAYIVWAPSPGENPAPIEKPGTYEITGLGGAAGSANTLHSCGTVELQWMPGGSGSAQGVTVNLFNDGESTGLFGYKTK